MTWTDVETIVRQVPRVRAGITVLKSGALRLMVSFSETGFKEIGEPKRVRVQSGEIGDAVMLRISKGDAIPMTPNGRKGHGGRFIIKAPATVPDGHREMEACQLTKGEDGCWLVALPLQAWQKQVTPVRPVTSIRPAQPSPAKPNGKINVVEYLTAKGMKVHKTAIGWDIDRQHHTPAAAVTIVNRYRRAAELPLVDVADLL